MERRCALLIHSVLVKETASFTTTNGAHFRTLIPFSPSLNAFYLTESIPRSKVTEPVQRGESLSIPFRSLSLDRACFASRVIVNLFNFLPINSRFERCERIRFTFRIPFQDKVSAWRIYRSEGYKGGNGGGRSGSVVRGETVLTGEIAR